MFLGLFKDQLLPLLSVWCPVGVAVFKGLWQRDGWLEGHGNRLGERVKGKWGEKAKRPVHAWEIGVMLERGRVWS